LAIAGEISCEKGKVLPFRACPLAQVANSAVKAEMTDVGGARSKIKSEHHFASQ